MISPGNKTLLIAEQMIPLLECSSKEKFTWYLLWIAITDFRILIIILFDMKNGISTKISQPRFGTTQALKCNVGISSQFKYIFLQ